MKKLRIILCIVLLQIPFYGICQIVTFDADAHKMSTTEKIDITIKYDSLRPIQEFHITNVEYARGIVGQQLYYPKNISAKFFSDKQQKISLTELPVDRPLLITAAMKNPYRDRMHDPFLLIELVDTTTNDTIYTSTIGVSVGFYEKTKQLHQGNKYRIKNRVNGIKDFVTGRTVDISDCGTLFTCKQVALHNGNIIAVLENEKGTITQSVGNNLVIIKDNIPYIYDDNQSFKYQGLFSDLFIFRNKIDPKKLPELLPEIIGDNLYKNFESQIYIDNFEQYISKIEAIVVAEKAKTQAIKDQEYAALKQKIANDDKKHLETCIAKFGQSFGSMVAKKEVAVGMNKEMCKTAWGSPNKIQTEQQYGSTVDTWIYTNIFSFDIKYIVFVNDKVIEFMK